MNYLEIIRKFISKSDVPGKFVLTELAAKAFTKIDKSVIGYIGNYNVSFDFNDQLQRLMYFDIYDKAEIRLLHELLKPADVFIDVGANIGYYSLIASNIVGPSGQIHAFEPIPKNVEKFQQIIVQNNINNIKVNQVAVGNKCGTLELYLGDDTLGNSGWASIVPSIKRPNKISVEVISLDDYIAIHGIKSIRLIKLDIEGSEFDALSGAEMLLSNTDGPDLICEINPYLLNKLNLGTQCITRHLSEKGYVLYHVKDSSLRPLEPEEEITQVINLYCTKSS